VAYSPVVISVGKSYVFDPDDPRAPADDQWAAMTEEERQRVLAMLPAEVPLELMPPEGDQHRKAKTTAEDVLGGFFKRIGRRVYVSSELAVYYPGKPRFAPDLLAVLDVELIERQSWVVQREGKGLDFVLEVTFEGATGKDDSRNVTLYAECGIPEYFVFDRKRLSLRGWSLPSPGARSYRPLLPQAGRFTSQVLGLELALEGPRLRFYYGGAALPETEELVDRLEGMLSALVERREEADRQREEADRQREEADRRAREAEAEVARLEAENRRLREELERRGR
jgi:Uma2 family endonuclease